MAEETQMMPLATARIHPRSEEESAGIFFTSRKNQKKSSKLLVYVLALIVIFGAVLLVFATVVLRANTPRVELSSVRVKTLLHGNSTLNATLITELAIRNENFGTFRFRNGTGGVFYGSVTVGEMKLREGRVSARDTERLRATVEVRSNQFVDTRNRSSDSNSGAFNLSIHAQLHGRVNLLNIMKRKRRPEMNCYMTLVLRSKSIQDLACD